MLIAAIGLPSTAVVAGLLMLFYGDFRANNEAGRSRNAPRIPLPIHLVCNGIRSMVAGMAIRSYFHRIGLSTGTHNLV